MADERRRKARARLGGPVGALHRLFAGGRFHGLALALGRLAMNDDERREAAIAACRRAIKRCLDFVRQRRLVMLDAHTAIRFRCRLMASSILS